MARTAEISVIWARKPRILIKFSHRILCLKDRGGRFHEDGSLLAY